MSSELYGRTGIVSAGFLLIAFTGLFTITELSTFAQGRARTASAERRAEILKRQGEQYEREKLKGEMKRPAERDRPRPVTIQVKQDFENLQANYNEIVLAMASAGARDYDRILGAVAEINRCSVRLKENLALARPKEAEAKPDDRQEISAPEEIEESLLALRKHIYNFVTNPLFEAPAVLDVPQAEKASMDLDSIIYLSERINRSGDKVKKN